MTYEATYEFPLGSGSLRKLDIQAESEEEARRKLGIVNPTLKFTPVERNPVARYLKSDDGQQFVKLLKDFESTMYAKVRYPEKFFDRYEKTTGVRIGVSTPGILISEQEDKWGDELSIRFELGDFEPNFPSDAKPRVYDGGKGILNDNAYIWFLIEQHGFRFRKP